MKPVHTPFPGGQRTDFPVEPKPLVAREDAIEWLRAHDNKAMGEHAALCARTALAMLEEPRMPKPKPTHVRIRGEGLDVTVPLPISVSELQPKG